jgi:GntR family transcriptional regulator, transcriptional repressor for pyruvate dehydrogenase complex
MSIKHEPSPGKPKESDSNYIHSVRRRTLPQEIVNSIGDLIIRGIWKPGEMIPTEKELAARFGVGRSTVREAVKSLVVLGVLEARAGEGSFLREPDSRLLSGAFRWGLLLSERNLDDLVEARVLVECECARRAALSRSKLTGLFAIQDKMTVSESHHQQFMDWDNRFHVCIATMAQNSIFINISSTIQEVVRVWYPDTFYIEGTKAATLQEHFRIAKAIEAGDPAAAQEAMAAHLLAASARLKRSLQQRATKTQSWNEHLETNFSS